MAKEYKIPEHTPTVIAKALLWRMANNTDMPWQESETLRAAAYNVGLALADMENPTFGFYIQGSIGNGKTTFAKAIRRAICDVMASRRPDNIVNADFRFCSAQKIVDYAVKGDPMFETLCKCKGLVVDDLCLEPVVVKTYGSEITPLISLIQERYENRLFTIFTSNRAITSLAQIYGERTHSRVVQMTALINFGNSKDLRQC